jgi:uncharacterized membrane protein YcaP (DUF421 family)
MFGYWSAIDIVITIMVGSARAMTGSAPLAGTMAAAAIMIFLHATSGHFVARSKALAYIFEGTAITIVDHGRIDHANEDAT